MNGNRPAEPIDGEAAGIPPEIGPVRPGQELDWTMATLGDPLADIGVLLNYWPDPSDTEDNRPIVNEGMEVLGLPTRAEMVARYSSRTGLDVETMPWYEAFACWKRAVIMQQLYTRYLRGETSDDRMAAHPGWIDDLARRALTILEDAGR